MFEDLAIGVKPGGERTGALSWALNVVGATTPRRKA